MPVMLGVFMGSLLGTRILVSARTRVLRLVFGSVVLVMGVEMICKALTGRL